MHMKGHTLQLLAERGPMWDYDIAAEVMQTYGVTGDYWLGTVRLTLADLYSSGLLDEVETDVDPAKSGGVEKLLFKFGLNDFGRSRMQQSGLMGEKADEHVLRVSGGAGTDGDPDDRAAVAGAVPGADVRAEALSTTDEATPANPDAEPVLLATSPPESGKAGRVAIIGAGPSGLSQLQAFEQARLAGADVPEVVCFEKQSDWGGLWNYTWRTGLDQYGDPVHGSMYRYLWSNGPKECLEFADYTFDEHFGKPIPSFPPRDVLFDYITGRAKKSDVRQHIQFDSAVRWISFDADRATFDVTVESRPDGSTRTEEFDHVIVATGHFSTPNLPEYPGFATFPGRVMHAHDYRDAQEFAGKDLLILGSSYSAEDIALQSKKYGASSVTVAYRNAPMGFGWPDGITEVPKLERVEGRTAHFVDGTSRDVDAIVMCTGYRHWFPFIEDELRLQTTNVLYPDNLYKGVVWTANPKLMYLGIQDQYYTFNMFDAQAWYARDVVLGRIAVPAREEMEADIASWRKRQDALDGPTDEIDFQTEYVRELLEPVDYPKFDLDLVREHFKVWEHHKEESITGYRDRSFASPCTGSVGPTHHTPWWDEPDDSVATFLRTEK